jgi:lysophospholipase L1-like esterase
MPKALLAILCLAMCVTHLFVAATPVHGQATSPATRPDVPKLHPALFLVGDSIMNTGTGTGERGPRGWGAEIIPMFNPDKIHVYNEGRGGRSSRGYIEEGAWTRVLARMEPGDFVIVHFGHNDSANSANYPDRISGKGSGDEMQEVDAPGGKKPVHTYGWYLRQYAADARAKGATLIICSPPPRNTWAGGKITRGFGGFVQWAADAARLSGSPYIDLNGLSADRFDALGQQESARYFADNQHTTKLGARLNAEAVVQGLRQLKIAPLTDALLPTPAPSPASRPAITPVPPATQTGALPPSNLPYFSPGIAYSHDLFKGK